MGTNLLTILRNFYGTNVPVDPPFADWMSPSNGFRFISYFMKLAACGLDWLTGRNSHLLGGGRGGEGEGGEEGGMLRMVGPH